MRIDVAEAAARIEARDLLARYPYPDQSDRVITHVRHLLGQELPLDLEDFYRQRIHRVGSYGFYQPYWNDWPGIGWHGTDELVTSLLHVNALPLANDGCGNYFCLDLSSNDRSAVYLIEAIQEEPEYCAGSSLGAFLMVLADTDRAFDEEWPEGWQLEIDPDIDKCPRAPPPWKVPLPWNR